MFAVTGALICALGFYMMTSFGSGTGLAWILVSLFVMGAGMGMALVASTNLAFLHAPEGSDGQLSGLTNTFRQAGSSAGVAVLNAVFMAFIVITPVPELVPGFRHAFFVAAVLALAASALALGMRDRTKAE